MLFCLHPSIIWCHSVCKNFIKKETYANHAEKALLLAGCSQTPASSSSLPAKNGFVLNTEHVAAASSSAMGFRKGCLNILFLYFIY